MSEELIKIEEINTVELFSAGGVDRILAAIRDEVINYIPDVSTSEGRAEIASRAHKVARSKTAIDKAGKELADKLNAQLKPINAERKKSRDTLDALKEEVRKPLTDYEEAEKKRISNIEKAIAGMVPEKYIVERLNITELKEALKLLEKVNAEDGFAEFKERAIKAKADGIEQYKEYIKIAVDKAKQAEELARLKKAEAERKQKEHEAQLIKEATAKAEREKQEAIDRQIAAENKAKEDAKKAEADRIAAEKKAAEDKAAAIKQAEVEKQAAIKAEQDRQAAAIKAEEDAAKKREADTKHKKSVNNAILEALQKCSGITKEQGIEIIKAIHKNQIPNTKINY